MRGSAVRPKERAARAADAKREDELCRQGAAVLPPSDICQKESMIMTYSQQVQNMCPMVYLLLYLQMVQVVSFVEKGI